MRRVIGVALLVALVGCTSGATAVPATEVVPRYDRVAVALKTAMADQVPAYKAPRNRGAAVEKGVCTYTTGFFDPDAAPSRRSIFAEPGWEQTKLRLNAVLSANQFGQLDQPSREGSGHIFRVTDGHGAHVDLREDGSFGVWGALVDTKDCTDVALGVR